MFGAECAVVWDLKRDGKKGRPVGCKRIRSPERVGRFPSRGALETVIDVTDAGKAYNKDCAGSETEEIVESENKNGDTSSVWDVCKDSARGRGVWALVH